MCEWHCGSQLQTELQCERRRNNTDRTVETDKQGFPHWCSGVCTSQVCVTHMQAFFFFFVTGVHTHTHTHRHGRLQQPSALETQRGKEAESRNGKADRRREVSQSARSLHRCCQNAILFNKTGENWRFQPYTVCQRASTTKWQQQTLPQFFAAPGKRSGTPNKATNRPSRSMWQWHLFDKLRLYMQKTGCRWRKIEQLCEAMIFGLPVCDN